MILKTKQPGRVQLELWAGEAVEVTLDGAAEDPDATATFGETVGIEIGMYYPAKALFLTFPKGRLYATSDGKFVVLCGRDAVLAEEMIWDEGLRLKKVYMEGEQ